MYENNGSSTGNGNGSGLGARTAAGAEQVKEHLRSARDAATDTLRDASREARTWSRGQFANLQDRVEAEPYRAAAWALGIGFVAGDSDYRCWRVVGGGALIDSAKRPSIAGRLGGSPRPGRRRRLRAS